MKNSVLLFLAFFATVFCVGAQNTSRYSLIPFPQQLTPRNGNFSINKNTVIFADVSEFNNETNLLRQLLGNAAFALKPASAQPFQNYILLKNDPSIQNNEGYELDVNSSRIILAAKTASGIFRGIETLRQLAPLSVENKNSTGSFIIPNVLIKDFPLYNYRGMHLDVSRHFFTIEYVKKFIDRMALYKFNKFHFHLTDDQGWRIEIKKYPLLTQKAAWRKFNSQDLDCIQRAKETGNTDMELDARFIKTVDGEKIYGGFYTQDQLRDLVKYAAARHIDIIPEIDMPGHMDAAIQQYPFLSCSEGGWKGGPFTVPICPCKESTFEFAENVFKEVFDIFPYEYVHLGADEVNKESWKKFDGCKELMQRENIKDYDELQSYFVHRMEKFFNANGKKLIGWDEILEGGVSPTAYVMYWRSWVPKAPVEAAKNGNKVIMTPGNPLYFDAIPDKNSLSNVYHFNPIPKGLNEAQTKNIIGAQANSWTEWIPSEARLEYMTLPRMLALPEVLWTGKQNNYKDFQSRLSAQLNRLDVLHTKYRLPDIEGLLEENVFVKSANFFPKPPAKDLVIRYTTNGTVPTTASPVLNKPLTITKSTKFKLAAFKNKLRGDVYTINFKQQNLIPNVMVKRTNTGLDVNFYKGYFKKTADLDALAATTNWLQKSWPVDADKTKGVDGFGLVYKGVIRVPADGIYSFFLTADDGAILNIADQLVVDNDGLHSAKEKSGQIALKKGMHFFELKFIEGGGGYTLNLEVMEPGENTRKPVPASWFE